MNVKKQYNDIISGTKTDILSMFLRWIFCGISFIYKGVMLIRSFLYSAGIKKKVKVGVPVISVGNLTLGGSGKTPCIVFIGNYLKGRGVTLAVIVRDIYDETKMLVDMLPGVKIFSGQNKTLSALGASQSGDVDIILVDDGFQHERLVRDLDILLIDMSKDITTEKVFPAGRLREPLGASKRADIAILTKSDELSAKTRIDKINNILDMPVLTARHKPTHLIDASDKSITLDGIKGKKVLILSAIANPDYFKVLAENSGAIVEKEITFPDHYAYSKEEISDIFRVAADMGIDHILTTAKDMVKIINVASREMQEKFLVLNIEFDILNNKEILIDRLDSICTYTCSK